MPRVDCVKQGVALPYDRKGHGSERFVVQNAPRPTLPNTADPKLIVTMRGGSDTGHRDHGHRWKSLS